MSAYGRLADYYDSLTEDVNYPELCGYLEEHWKRGGLKPRRLLDMACGTGSLTLEFARHGIQTVGMDLSAEMLARAENKIKDFGENKPVFLQADMSAFSLKEPVDAAVCMLDSFNYLVDPGDGVSALRCFYDSLRPGGMLIYDVRPRRQLMEFDGQMFMDETDDVVCVWRTEFSEEDNICFYGMDIFTREGETWQRQREEHYEYAYRLRWLKRQMEQIGFQEIRFFGDRTMLRPDPNEDRVFITARKGENHE